MKKKCTLREMFLGIMCCLVMCGCGKDAIQTPIRDYEQSYFFEKTEMGISKECIPIENGILLTTRNAIFVGEKAGNKDDSYEKNYLLYIQDLEKASEKPIEITRFQGNLFLGMEITVEDETEILSVYYNNEDQYFIDEYDLQGNSIRKIAVISPKTEGFFYVFGMTRLNDKEYLAFNNDALYRINQDGEVQEKVFSENMGSVAHICRNDTGGFYLSYLNPERQCMLGRLNADTLELQGSVQTDQVIEFRNHGKHIYFRDGSKFMEIDENLEQMTELFDVENLDETGGKFKDFICENGQWYAISQDSENTKQTIFLYHFFKISSRDAEQYEPEQLYTGKETIKIYDSMGVIQFSTIEDIIESYNSQSEKYHVEILVNENEYADAELLSKTSPDILYTSLSSEVDRYQKNGYLIDLIPLCKNIDDKDIHELAFREFGQDNELYALPTSIFVSTVLCMGEDLPEEGGWTVPEFLDWIENNRVIYTDGWLDRIGLLEIILNGSINEYVDFDKGEAHFKDENFKSMLKRVKELSFEAEDFFGMDNPSQGAVLRTGGTAMVNTLAENEFRAGRPYRVMGYPNNERREKGYLLYVPSLSIFQNSSHKEAAMDFIEYVVAYQANELYRCEAEGKRTRGQVWSLKSMTELDFSLAVGTHYIYEENEKIPYECTEKQVTMLNTILENAIPSHDLEYSVFYKVLEETALYFEDERSLDDVCDYLQDTVTIMINE